MHCRASFLRACPAALAPRQPTACPSPQAMPRGLCPGAGHRKNDACLLLGSPVNLPRAPAVSFRVEALQDEIALALPSPPQPPAPCTTAPMHPLSISSPPLAGVVRSRFLSATQPTHPSMWYRQAAHLAGAQPQPHPKRWHQSCPRPPPRPPASPAAPSFAASGAWSHGGTRRAPRLLERLSSGPRTASPTGRSRLLIASSLRCTGPRGSSTPPWAGTVRPLAGGLSISQIGRLH